MKGTKSKPAVDLEFEITEIYITPGTNQITVTATSDDSEVKQINRTVDIQDKVDALTNAYLNNVNDLFRKLAAVGLGVAPAKITGDIFTKSS